MLNLLFGKTLTHGAQKFIERLQPKIDVHVPEDLPVPSVQMLKKMSVTAAKIKSMEEEIERLSDA